MQIRVIRVLISLPRISDTSEAFFKALKVYRMNIGKLRSTGYI